MGNDASKQSHDIQEWKSYLEHSRKNFEQPRQRLLVPLDPQLGFTLQEFDVYSELGSGAFADVFAAVHKTSKNWLALKILDKAKVLEKSQEEHVKTERKLLNQMNLPFIIRLLLSFQMNASLCLGLEFVPGGELFILLRQKGHFNEKQAVFYASQIVITLEYIHNLDIVYRDLKPENILMDARGYLKVADFGFAKIVPKRTYTMCGTPEYIAPEILVYKGYGKAVDWWALGILIYEMLCGASPFCADDVMDIYSNIIEAKVKFPRQLELSRAARHLIKHLLEKDLTKRYGNLHAGVSDIRDHPWFVNLDWVSIFEGTCEAPIKVNVNKPTRSDKAHMIKFNSILNAQRRGPYEMNRFEDF